MQVLKRRGDSFVAASLLAITLFVSSGAVMSEQGNDPVMAGCIYFGNPERTSARHKYVIEKPGHYCLTEDLHARIEFADHPAEDTMIAIWSGDVVLDLQGHTLGRGRIFKNLGGDGIEIASQNSLAKNIVIRNGTLQDFEVGIYASFFRRNNPQDSPTFDPKTNTYHFPANNITLENITFKNNKKDFDIRLPDVPNK
jgi:hypothetical protein